MAMWSQAWTGSGCVESRRQQSVREPGLDARNQVYGRRGLGLGRRWW